MGMKYARHHAMRDFVEIDVTLERVRHQSVANTDALRGTLHEDTRVQQRLRVTLLDTKVHYIPLVRGRVIRVHQRQLQKKVKSRLIQQTNESILDIAPSTRQSGNPPDP